MVEIAAHFGIRKLGKSLRDSNFQLGYMHYVLERREEHTAVANTHMEDLCVGGVAVLLNDMAKLTLSDADLTVLTTFVRKRLVANVCRIMIYGHMHCIDTCPLPLMHTHPHESRLFQVLSQTRTSHPPSICR